MKTNIILTLSILALSLALIGCGAPAANTTNAKPANATNTNTAAANTAAAPATDGQVIKIDEAGIQMTVPKGFKFSKDGDDTIVMSEDEGVDIRFSVPKSGDYAKAVTDAATELDDYLTDIKTEDKGSKRDVNGMEGTSMMGTAKDSDGDVVKWNLTILNAPKKPVLVNIYAVQASLDKHAAEVKIFLESVKKQ